MENTAFPVKEVLARRHTSKKGIGKRQKLITQIQSLPKIDVSAWCLPQDQLAGNVNHSTVVTQKLHIFLLHKSFFPPTNYWMVSPCHRSKTWLKRLPKNESPLRLNLVGDVGETFALFNVSLSSVNLHESTETKDALIWYAELDADLVT